MLVLNLDDVSDSESHAGCAGDLVLIALGDEEELEEYAMRLLKSELERLLLYRIRPRSIRADHATARLHVLTVREPQPDVPDLDRFSAAELLAFAKRHEDRRTAWKTYFKGAGWFRGEQVMSLLVGYAEARLRALRARGSGQLEQARAHEVRCEQLKERLPRWGRWW